MVDGVAGDGPIPPITTPPAAVRTLTATYTRPYQMHASIGPSAALAEWDDGNLTVWSHTQGIFVVRAALAQALGVEIEKVRVIHVEGPGCYGHNGADDAMLDAALLARAVPGRPVLLKWMREDEHAWEPYGPPMVVKVQASVDAAGRLCDWNHDTWSHTHLYRALPFGERSAFVAAWHRETPMPAWKAQPVTFYHAGHPSQCRSALHHPGPPHRQAFRRGSAAPHVRAAQPRRLCERVRDRVVHGRAGTRDRRRPARLPVAAPRRRRALAPC